MRLLLLWHMHQPMYRDYASQNYAMPWVYLHATKDYAEMARIVGRHERARVTFNFTPCLLESLADYAAGRARDPVWESLCLEPETLDRRELDNLAAQYFCTNIQRSILPHPRFRALYVKHQRGVALTHTEFLDLQVLFHLAWVGESYRREDPVIRSLVQKAAEYTRDDRAALRKRLEEIIRSVFPTYAELAARGRIEISTTPFYHPILPLLIDSNIASASSPGIRLPETRFRRRRDAEAQTLWAKETAEEAFSTELSGFWPSEGAVSEEALSVLAGSGATWAATDEAILHGSKIAVEEAEPGERLRPGSVYQPYRFLTPRGEIMLFFRDHALSDAIGFVYQNWDPEIAVDDFVTRLAGIEKAHRDPTVSVILDGENAWEHYHANGFEFLDLLYARLASTPWIRMSTFGEVTAERSACSRLERLHPGSWIDGNFRIWIGDKEKNRAWVYLSRARSAAEERLGDDALFGSMPAGNESDGIDYHLLRRSLLAAEGSDWFWWFGEPNSSAHDAMFDELFRKHLQNVYLSLGQASPSYLDLPVASPVRLMGREMTAFFTPIIDGRDSSYFEWLAAAVINLQSGSAMRRALHRMTRLLYGADAENFYLRVDFREKATSVLEAFVLRLEIISERRVVAIEVGPGRTDRHAAWGTIFEAQVPYAELDIGLGTRLELVLTLRNEHETERFPPDGTLSLKVPEKDFELLDWMV